MVEMKNVSILLILIIGLCAALHAQVIIYDNFGEEHEGWDYNYQMGWTVAGENNPTQYGVEQAIGFTSTHSGALGNLWVPIWRVPSSTEPDTVYVRLAPNNNGQYPLPEDVMIEWVLSGFDDWSQWNPPFQLDGDGIVTLEENQEYWIWMEGTDMTWAGWCMNIEPSLVSPHTLRRENEDWLSVSDDTASAFRVSVCMAINNLVVISNPGEDFAQCSWTAPLEGDPSGYNVYLDGELLGNTQEQEWTLTNLQCGSVYEVGVVAEYNGSLSTMETVQFLYIGTHAQQGITAVTQLVGNYPNPFNPTTEITYSLAQPDHVTLSVYNAKGQHVRTLVDTHQDASTHTVVWDGRDNRGTLQPSGLYMCRMHAQDSGMVRCSKMLMMK